MAIRWPRVSASKERGQWIMDVCGWDGWMDVTLRLRPIHPLSFASHLRAALLDLGLFLCLGLW